MSEELLKAMAQSIIDGEAEVAADLAKQSIDTGMDPLDGITKGYILGVNEVGDSFSCGNVFLPELVMAGEAMKSAIAVLEPELKKKGTVREVLGKVVIATVEGDIHEIGKSLVGTMLTAAGFDVYDLGVNVPADKIMAKIEEVEIMTVSNITTKGIKIWIWVQNNRILKAINRESGTISIYDECDNIILRRTGLSRQQVQTIEMIFATYALNKIGDRKEPYTYL